MRRHLTFALASMVAVTAAVVPIATAPVSAAELPDAPFCTPAHLKKCVSEGIIIKAPPAVVWQSMQVQRVKDPNSTSVKVMKRLPSGKEVEQCFSFQSPFGSAECALELYEKGDMRIDYNLKNSDDLRAMEGSWVLTPADEGRSTKLTLTSYVETLHVPLPRIIVNSIIRMNVQHNLNMVKKIAETPDTAVAQNGSVQ